MKTNSHRFLCALCALTVFISALFPASAFAAQAADTVAQTTLTTADAQEMQQADSAVTALQLVLCEDEERAAELAHKLNEINTARQETEGEIAKAAQAQLEAEPAILEDRVILIWGRDWHPGVIGIVASRLVEKTGRPVIVVSIDEHGEGKGSGRSVQGFNLHACIASCEDLLLRFGGHAMAAGLSVREENLPELRRRLNEWAARECPVLVTPPLECDLSIHLDRITVESVRRLDQLAPYGAENPAPVFLLEKAVERILTVTGEAFEGDDTQKAMQVEPLEEVIDVMVERLRDQHIRRLKDGVCSIDTGVVFLDVLNNVERISDHCSNVAVRMIGMEGGEDYDSHTLKSIMHHNPTKDYMLEYEQCRKEYLVPLEQMEA